jgi:hypothetical protein
LQSDRMGSLVEAKIKGFRYEGHRWTPDEAFGSNHL